jgi:hypothetical protein
MVEDTGAQGDTLGASEELNTPGEIQGGAWEGDPLRLIGGKMDEMAKEMTEETGDHGDVHLHAQRKMDEMTREMFEED